MKARTATTCVAMMVCCCVFGAVRPGISQGQGSSKGLDRKDILRQARQSHYSLKREGLTEFECDMKPHWEGILADLRKTDPAAADAAARKLSALVFTVTVGLDGNAKVTHNDIPAENEEMAKGLTQIYSGMEQMIHGFFQTWSVFVINSPFPEVDSDYELTDQRGQWNLSYKEGSSTSIVTIMNGDYTIQELKVTTPEFVSSIQPQFNRSARGFLLSGYQADYRGKSPGEATRLQVAIVYQDVSGLQLAQELSLSGTYGGSPFQAQLTFSGCQVKKN